MGWFTLDTVSWLAVVLATVAAFLVGALWYSPALFGRAWMGHVGLTDETVRQSSGAGLRYGLTALVAFVTAVAMNVLMVELGVDSVVGAVLFGAFIGLVFRLGNHLIHHGFEQKSYTLSVINGGHDMVALAAAGAIIASFI